MALEKESGKAHKLLYVTASKIQIHGCRIPPCSASQDDLLHLHSAEEKTESKITSLILFWCM